VHEGNTHLPIATLHIIGIIVIHGRAASGGVRLGGTVPRDGETIQLEDGERGDGVGVVDWVAVAEQHESGG
jgi:hypothetical protein